MKNKKKRTLFVVLIVVLVMSISSTAMAVGYSGSFASSVKTKNSVNMTTDGYIRDANTVCFHDERPNPRQVGYTDQLWIYVPEGDYIRDLGNSKLNSSGGSINLDWDGYEVAGKLQFINTQLPGYTLVISGNMTGH